MEPVHRYHPIGREVAGVVDHSPAHLLLGDELAKSVLGTDAVHERHDPHLVRPGDPGAEAHDADDWFAHVSPLRPLQSRHPGPKVSNVKGKMSMTTPPLARARLLHHALLGP